MPIMMVVVVIVVFNRCSWGEVVWVSCDVFYPKPLLRNQVLCRDILSWWRNDGWWGISLASRDHGFVSKYFQWALVSTSCYLAFWTVKNWWRNVLAGGCLKTRCLFRAKSRQRQESGVWWLCMAEIDNVYKKNSSDAGDSFCGWRVYKYSGFSGKSLLLKATTLQDL